MNIQDFNFTTKQVGINQLECSVISKESNNKYTIIINANGIPPNQWIFDRFMEDKGLKHFFVDIESEIVQDVKSGENQVVIANSEKVEKIVDKVETLV